MIGKYQLQIGADEFLSGQASSDYATDGALGSSCHDINPFITAGLLYSTATPTDLSSGLHLATGVRANIVASCEDAQAAAGTWRVLTDDTGNFYTATAGGTLTDVTSSVKAYSIGVTDMAAFNNFVWITSNTDVARFDTGAGTVIDNYWSGTLAQTALTGAGLIPHPLLVFENNLWIGDGNLLHKIDSSLTATASFLTLNTNELIYSLGIDPATGLMMIGTKSKRTLPNNRTAKYFVYLYDGASAKPRRKIPVHDVPTAFHSVASVVYVGLGASLGIWNGNGVSFLRRLINVDPTTTEQLLWKHKITNHGNILLYTDKHQVLAYGETMAGKKGFFTLLNNPKDGTSDISFLATMGSNGGTRDFVLGTNNGATGNYFAYDLSSKSVGAANLYTNNIFFPRPIYLRRMRILTTGITTTAGLGSVAIIDEKGTAHAPASAAFVVAAAASPQSMFDFDFTALKILAAQVKILADTQNFGLVRIFLYYDIAE